MWVDEYLKDFPDQQDVLRYVLCANAPETKDNDFTWKDFQEKNNSELASIFGNFVNRTFVLMHKLCGGKVPKLHEDVMDELDRNLIGEIKKHRRVAALTLAILMLTLGGTAVGLYWFSRRAAPGGGVPRTGYSSPRPDMSSSRSVKGCGMHW